jgi:hypothetical protein
MKTSDLALSRFHNQLIAGDQPKRPEETVRRMGAIQAQDYLGALWAVGLRTGNSTQSDVEQAIASGRIVRMWPMRRTIHIVHRDDARWMHALMVPRLLENMGQRGERIWGLTETILERCRNITARALTGEKRLGRSALYELMAEEGVDTSEGRGLHIMARLAHDGLICFGPREGKQPTFVLFDEWVPKGQSMSREESLRELALRYFTAHGPAQIADLGWWSGLTQKDIRLGIEFSGRQLRSEVRGDKTYYMAASQPRAQRTRRAHLLPPFDELLVGYRDRDASLEAVHAKHINPGANGIFSPIVAIDGQVVGTWRRTIAKKITISIKPFTPFTAAQKEAVADAEARYRRFVK